MIEITWLGHGSFQFRLASGEVILMDPWADNPRFPTGHKFDRIDAILVTHGHFDHIHSVRPLAQQFSPTVIAIYETCHWLDSKGVKNTSGMNKGGSQETGPVKVTMTHAVHSCGIMDDDGKIIYGGEASGYVLRFADERCLYFAGDTNVFSDMALIEELYHPELVFLPIGDLYTMSPHEAGLACRLLKPKRVVPMHFGTFPPLTGTPEQLAEQDLAGAALWALDPGKPVEW
jgi:L-ascorbate metabolism protein UlaG (beta-lactamase superfamily)